MEDIKNNVKNLNNMTPLNMALDKKYNNIARTLMDSGAVSNAQTISYSDRNASRGLVQKGAIAHKASKYKEARKLYLKALEYNSNNSDAYGNIALVDIHQLDYESCFKNAQKAIKITPRNSHAIYSAAQCLFMLKKPRKEYLPYYRQYILLEPNNYRTKKLLKEYPELSED